MRDESLKKYDRIVALLSEGKTITEALEKVKMSSATYHRVKKLREGDSTKTTSAARRKKAFIDLTPESLPPGSVTLIVCSPDQLGVVMRGLR